MPKLSKVYSAQVSGLGAHIITIEVDLFRGFHTFSVVGLADKAVEESRDRISSAVKSLGFTSPKSKSQKVVVSLAPADLKKEGPLFDLPMALAYLLAAGEIQFNPEKKLFLGELSLSGNLSPIKGTLLLAQRARDEGFEELYVPKENAAEAALIDGIGIFGAETLAEVVRHINKKKLDEKMLHIMALPPIKQQEKTSLKYERNIYTIDFGDIEGQERAKRGLEIAAAGGHNVSFYGPPGTGKTLLAKAFISILPPLTFNEALEVTGIHSVTGKLYSILISEPPFRAPHHTSSYTAVVGGGTFPKPGEITLAHRGVLFLDEFPEFDRRVIESLRQPLEDGKISIARVRGAEIFPAVFILIAALNPCPCGFRGDPRKECVCTPSHLMKYQRKVSGPIIDRIDMWIEVPRIAHEKLSGNKDVGAKAKEETREMKRRILVARKTQSVRFEDNEDISLNSRMGVRELKKYITLTEKTKTTLDNAAKKLDLSARAYHRIIKLARTIADLEQHKQIEERHILEALQYRPRNLFAL